MATVSVDSNTTIDISDDLAGQVDTAPITIQGVDQVSTNATEIKLNAQGSINTETAGSSVLTGETLSGTADAPAGIALASTDTTETQVLAVNTKAVKNTVITTKAPTSAGEQVAKADIILNSETAEDVSVKTSSTEEKSVVTLNSSVVTGATVELTEAGGDLTVKSATVSNLKVESSGSEFSEITFGEGVQAVDDAQIALKEAGGAITVEEGNIANSVIAVEANADTISTVTIASNVEEVAGTQIQLAQGTAEVGVAAQTVTDLVINSTSKQATSVTIDSDNVSGFVLSATRAKADLNLSSDNTVSDTTLISSTKKGFNATIDARNENTSITATKGKAEATFSGKSVNPTISNEGKGETVTDFSAKAVGASLSTDKGAITASFEGKAKDIVVKAAKTKKGIDLSYEKALTDGNFKLGKGADELVFGGAIKDSKANLGDDNKTDSVTIDRPGKSVIDIKNFGQEDLLIVRGDEFTAEDISNGAIDQFSGIGINLV